MTKKNAPKFDFGPAPASIKKALAILEEGSSANDSPQLLQWAEDELIREEVRRVQIIMRHYQIEYFSTAGLGFSIPVPTLNFEAFALFRRLASDFIPGFNPRTRKGNPNYAAGDHRALVAFIDAEMASKGVKLSQAKSNARRKKDAPWSEQTREQIESNYHRGKEAIRRETEVIREALAQAEADEKERAERRIDAIGRPKGLL
jgi:hypothetical protein